MIWKWIRENNFLIILVTHSHFNFHDCQTENRSDNYNHINQIKSYLQTFSYHSNTWRIGFSDNCRCHLKIDGKFTYGIEQVNNTITFFQLRSAYWEKWSSKLAHFLVFQNFDPIYLKMLHKVILLTITTINLAIKLICLKNLGLTVVIP